MTVPPPMPSPGQVSPDGQHVWNGTAWIPNPNLPKQKKSHTVRNVVIGVVIGVVLLVGGCVALFAGAANEVSKSIEEDANKPGGSDSPLTIVPGEAFEVDGFNYSPGWTIATNALGDFEVNDLKVTNNRDEKDGAIVEIKLWAGSEVLASVDCTTEQIVVGTTVSLNCFGADDMPASYDKITINDTF